MKVQICSMNVRQFLLAGNCECKIFSRLTGNMYDVKIVRHRGGPCYKLYCLGIDSVYSYLGYYDTRVNLCVPYENVITDTLVYKCLKYCLTHRPLELEGRVKVYHVGRCACCGRKLTDKLSIEYGIGPKCRRILNDTKNIFASKR